MAITFAASAPKAHSFLIFPKGNYPFGIVDAKEGKLAKDGARLKAGTQFIELKIKVTNPKTDETVTIFDNLYFDGSTFWKVDAMLKAIGKHPGEGEVIEIDCFDLIGEAGFADIKIGKNNRQEERNEVAAYTWEES
ncbi:hypothetical protein UFOVP813_7 [uncultured Caudovirales phage]|uniref:Uncharacterized protein n=1 Tax=uncultured Caudovirales phage TaxID=2100421 RepID=A0A6J5NWU4_9CAUD|nr:hypothetical protein UFOVP813_7 [uncultured Caudovirales phage]